MVAGEAIVSREESPGSVEQRQSLTATGGDPRESATETIPPGTFVGLAQSIDYVRNQQRCRVRVKGVR